MGQNATEAVIDAGNKLLIRGVETVVSLDDKIAKNRSSKASKRMVEQLRRDGKIEIDFEDIEKFPKRMLDVMRRDMNIETVRAKADGWVANLKTNLPRLADASAKQMFKPPTDAGPGIPSLEGACIVAGASNPETPLIAKQYAALRSARIPIVACDRAYGMLVDHGRTPEYAVVLENNRDPNHAYLLDGDRRAASKDSILIASVVTHPDILADWKGDVAFYRCHFPDEIINFNFFLATFFEGLPDLWHGGNVGTCSYAAAVFLRANPIAIVGMDFGWESGHVDPVRGKQFITDPLLLSYAEGLVQIMKIAIDSGIKTYNCTGGGVVRASWLPDIPLADFLAKHDERWIAEVDRGA